MSYFGISEDDDDDAPPAKVGKVRGGDEGAHMKDCENLVTMLMKENDAWPFLRPVTKRDVSNLQMELRSFWPIFITTALWLLGYLLCSS